MKKTFTSLFCRWLHRHQFLKIAPLMLALLMVSPLLVQASASLLLQQQETITIKGTVIDDADNSALPGVSIVDPAKKTLGLTNVDGKFNIRVARGTEVSFSFLGYTAYKQTFTTNQDNITIRLKASASDLNEVVVTALGIKREEKALGYAVTSLKNKDLTDAISNNWTDALQGKVAGLNLIKSGGGPAGSSKIILRGETNLDGDNAALIVVDGVATSGSSARSFNPGTGGSAYLAADSPTDFGNSLADINPNDIESVSVLKGPAAAALYGLRGSHGAIIITTKSGTANKKGLGITFNSNTALDATYHFPDYQEEYGQGADGQDLYYSYLATADGASTRSTSSAWGPKFNGQSYFQYDPATGTTSATRLPWVAYPHNHQDFFQVGKTFTNSLSLEGGNDKTTARLSVTNLNNTWIIPNTGYKRNTIALSVNSKINDKLTVASKVNYTNKFSDNLPSTGYNNQAIMYFIRGLTPNMDINWFKNYYLAGQEDIAQNRPFSSLLDNPYLIAYQDLNKSNRNQITGNVSATYNFLKNLSLTVRTSTDLSYEERSQQRPKSTNKFPDGSFRTQTLYSQEITSDFLARYNNKIGKKIEYNITLGGSHLTNHYNKNEQQADKLLYPGVYTLANSKVTLVSLPYSANYTFNSFYGLGSISYDSFIYLDLTARNDWASTLATPTASDKASFFYPSASLSVILSEKLKLPKVIDYLKVRGSLAATGSGGVTPYLTSYVYLPTTFAGGLTNPTSLANDGLKPQRTKSIELGAELRMFNSRLGFDLSVYKNNTFDQILPAKLDPASGYPTVIVNAGEVQNKGIELAVNGTPVKTKDFRWQMNGTFTANRNTIISLGDTSSTLVLATGPRGTIEARVGGSFGAIYGLGYTYSPAGKIVYSNGLPVLSTNTKYVGNANPQFKGSIGSTFTYKKFSLSVLFDGQWGGKAYSLTTAVLSEEGKLEKTVPGRYNGIIGDGVMLDASGNYVPNTVVAPSAQAYYNAHFSRDNVEANTFATDFIKFREARLDYSLSPRLTQRLGLQRATIGVYGRNLFMWTNWPAFDPEFGTLDGSGQITSGFETGQFPSTRTYGVNLTVSF